MTATFPVVSVDSSAPKLIKVRAVDVRRGKRAAKYAARKTLGMCQPRICTYPVLDVMTGCYIDSDGNYHRKDGNIYKRINGQPVLTWWAAEDTNRN